MAFVDEAWFSLTQPPALRAWADGPSLQLEEFYTDACDKQTKAVASYGWLRSDTRKVSLRFVEQRPNSESTVGFLEWVCEKLCQEGKKALILVWDNASWHTSKRVRQWLRSHNREVRRSGGVRIVACYLPTRSPWLNAIEPHWIHGKRAAVEPKRRLDGAEMMSRLCDYFGCEHLPALSN